MTCESPVTSDHEAGEPTTLAPDGAFAVLGNATRIRILQTLGDANEPLTFSELRGRVGVRDSGQFSYHLGKLTGHFVRKADGGYVLRFAGEQVVNAVLSGTFTEDPSLDPEEIDERCAFCGGTVEMAYDETFISVRCTDCGGVAEGDFPGGTYMHFGFPPAGLHRRSREAAVDAAHVFYDSKIAPMIKGVCPECAGRVDITFDVCADHELGDSGLCPNCDTRFEVWSIFECEHCLYSRQSAMWFAALNHPAVVAFYYDHGLDETIPFRKLTWDNARFVRDIAEAVVDTDPYRFRVTISVDDERLVVEMDENLDVVEVTASPSVDRQ